MSAAAKANTTIADVIQLTPIEMKGELIDFIKMRERLALANPNDLHNRRSLMLWGSMGIGKSSLFREVAAELGYECVVMSLTQYEQADLKGVPVPGRLGSVDVTKWLAPEVLYRKPGEKVLILLDELPNASPEVQVSAYSLMLDGKVGDGHYLPLSTIVVGAGNLQSDQGFTNTMPAPLRNRMAHYYMTHDLESFIKVALRLDFHPAVVGFISAFPDKLFGYEPKSKSNAFTTSRSLHALSDALKYSNFKEKNTAMQRATIASWVGSGFASAFLPYYHSVFQLPSTSDILDGKPYSLESAETKNKSSFNALLFALNVSLMSVLRNEFNRLDRDDSAAYAKFHARLDNYFGFIEKHCSPDVIVMSGTTLLQDYKIAFRMSLCPRAEHTLRAIKDLVIAADSAAKSMKK